MKLNYIFLLSLFYLDSCMCTNPPIQHKKHPSSQKEEEEENTDDLEEDDDPEDEILDEDFLAEIDNLAKKADEYLALPTKERKYSNLFSLNEELIDEISLLEEDATTPKEIEALDAIRKRQETLAQEQKRWEECTLNLLQGSMDLEEVIDYLNDDSATEKETLLNLCCSMELNGNKEDFLFIIARTTDIDAKNETGFTALHTAIDVLYRFAGGNYKKAKWLLEAGADPTIPFPDGTTVLDYALTRLKIEQEYDKEETNHIRNMTNLVNALKKYGAGGSS